MHPKLHFSNLNPPKKCSPISLLLDDDKYGMHFILPRYYIHLLFSLQFSLYFLVVKWRGNVCEKLKNTGANEIPNRMFPAQYMR